MVTFSLKNFLQSLLMQKFDDNFRVTLLFSTRIVHIIAPLRQNNFLVFTRGGGGAIIWNFHKFSPFQMSSSELKLYFITYYRPLVYFEVFSIYIVFFLRIYVPPPKKQKKIFLDFLHFWIFFFPCFREGGQLYGQFGYKKTFSRFLVWEKIKKVCNILLARTRGVPADAQPRGSVPRGIRADEIRKSAPRSARGPRADPRQFFQNMKKILLKFRLIDNISFRGYNIWFIILFIFELILPEISLKITY